MQGSGGAKLATKQKGLTQALAEAKLSEQEKKTEDHMQLVIDAMKAKGVCMLYVAFFTFCYAVPALWIISGFTKPHSDDHLRNLTYSPWANSNANKPSAI